MPHVNPHTFRSEPDYRMSQWNFRTKTTARGRVRSKFLQNVDTFHTFIVQLKNWNLPIKNSKKYDPQQRFISPMGHETRQRHTHTCHVYTGRDIHMARGGGSPRLRGEGGGDQLTRQSGLTTSLVLVAAPKVRGADREVLRPKSRGPSRCAGSRRQGVGLRCRWVRRVPRGAWACAPALRRTNPSLICDIVQPSDGSATPPTHLPPVMRQGEGSGGPG